MLIIRTLLLGILTWSVAVLGKQVFPVITDPTAILYKGTVGFLPCRYQRGTSMVTWYKGKSLQEDARVLIFVGIRRNGDLSRSGPSFIEDSFHITDDYSLIIKHVKVAHEGRYYCEVVDLEKEVSYNYTDLSGIVAATETAVPVNWPLLISVCFNAGLFIIIAVMIAREMRQRTSVKSELPNRHGYYSLSPLLGEKYGRKKQTGRARELWKRFNDLVIKMGRQRLSFHQRHLLEEQLVDTELQKELSDDATTDEIEEYVFYLAMKGDYNRYMSSCKSFQNRTSFIDKAKKAYEGAMNLCTRRLPPGNNTRLAISVKLSVFNFETLHNSDKACELARMAIENATERQANNNANYDPESLYEDLSSERVPYMLALHKYLEYWITDRHLGQGVIHTCELEEAVTEGQPYGLENKCRVAESAQQYEQSLSV